MNSLLTEFLRLLDAEDKKGCIDFAVEKLKSGEIDILTLYREILTPAQNQAECWADESFCIWKEHVRTSIVRTVIECCYPYVIEESKKFGSRRDEKVLIGCPGEEYHEIGARIAADYFTLLGYDVTFVGANTPRKEILDALQHINPLIIGISVTNFYNLVAAEKLVGELKRIRNEKSLNFKIVVGGNAFRTNQKIAQRMGVDALLQNFEDIRKYCTEMK